MTARRFVTQGHDPHRAQMCEARRRHIHGPIVPMDDPRPSLWRILIGKAR